MVVLRWRSARHAAAWNGTADQPTIPVARTATDHCHPRNCSAGTIEIRMTGTANRPVTTQRSRRASSDSGPDRTPGAGIVAR